MHSYGELAAQHRTGNCRVRVGWFGRLILQVEIKSPRKLYPAAPPPPGTPYDPWAKGSYTFWRDARPEDVTQVGGFIANAKEAPNAN